MEGTEREGERVRERERDRVRVTAICWVCACVYSVGEIKIKTDVRVWCRGPRRPWPFLTHLPECILSWLPGFFHIHSTALRTQTAVAGRHALLSCVCEYMCEAEGGGVESECVCARECVCLCVRVRVCYKRPSISRARSSSVAGIRMTSLPPWQQ